MARLTAARPQAVSAGRGFPLARRAFSLAAAARGERVCSGRDVLLARTQPSACCGDRFGWRPGAVARACREPGFPRGRAPRGNSWSRRISGRIASWMSSGSSYETRARVRTDGPHSHRDEAARCDPGGARTLLKPQPQRTRRHETNILTHTHRRAARRGPVAQADDKKPDPPKDAGKPSSASASTSVVTSSDGTATVTIDINGKKETRTFKLGDGTNTFSFSTRLPTARKIAGVPGRAPGRRL